MSDPYLFELNLPSPGSRERTRVVEREGLWVIESLIDAEWKPEFEPNEPAAKNADALLRAAFQYGKDRCPHRLAKEFAESTGPC